LDGTSDPIAALVKETNAITAIKASRFAKHTLMAGVTTVRDAGGRGEVDLSVRDAVNQGIIQGPRILASRHFICMTGGHGWNMGGREADGEDDVRKAVREQIKEGADVIKFMATGGLMTPGEEPGATQLSESELCVGIDEAHKAGKKTFAHAQGTDGIISAIRAGIDSIEHGVFLNDEAIELMLKKNLPLVPTLTALYQIQFNGTKAGIPDFAVNKCVRSWPFHLKSAEMAAKSGVRIALGTDAGSCCNPHGTNLQELKRLTEIGMSPMQAIESGTRIAAQVLGLEKLIGTLEAGKIADIVVSDVNPVQNIELLKDQKFISMVIKSGKIEKQIN
jgi:imidazolonepropionase-like amidohydrolase